MTRLLSGRRQHGDQQRVEKRSRDQQRRDQRSRDQRGAVLPLAAVAVVLALIATSLAVDLGMLAADRRTNQKVADLASLDAVRVLPADPTGAARASATRNGFNWSAPGYTLQVDTLNAAGVSVAPASASRVRVTARSPRKPLFPFVGSDTRTITAHAIASMSPPIASFTIGSSVASIDTTRSQILNRLMNNIACPPPAPPCNSANITVAGYQGLAASNVNLDTLRTQMGFATLTPEQVLTQNFNAADLIGSSADVLSNDPSKAQAAADLNILEAALRARATPLPTMNFGQLLKVAPGSEGSALASSFNVLQLVTGTAQVANGTNAIAIPNLSIAPVAGLLGVDASVTLISKPVTYVGPAPGVTVFTTQADVTVTAHVSVAGLVDADIPIHLTGGGASGSLTSIQCATVPPYIGVHVDTSAASASANATLRVLGGQPLVDLAMVKPLGVATSTPDPTTFNYPAEFAPLSKHIGSTTLGLSAPGAFSLNSNLPVNLLNAVVNNLLNATVIPAVFAALGPILNSVDTLAIRPIMQALGLDIGAADVTANFITPPPPACSGGTPTLVE